MRVADSPLRPVVARARVSAVVRLVDGSIFAGDLYAAARGSSAESEPMLERLNDSRERYLPLAYGDRHYLLNKTSIVSVELAQIENVGAYDPTRERHTFPVELLLGSGDKIRGVVHSGREEVFHRTLDHLNDGPRGFLRIVRRPGVVYVNHDHVVTVCDVIER